MSKGKICVFGSEGLLGTAVCKSAKESGYEVIAVDILKEGINSKNYNDAYYSIDVIEAIKGKKLSSLYDTINDLGDLVALINCILPKFSGDVEAKAISDTCLKLYGLDHILCCSLVEALKNIPTEKRKHCKVILTSSIKSRRPPKFWQYENTTMTSPGIYGAMKSAINYLIQDMTSRHANNNISFAAVAPGGILGELHSKQFLENYNSSTSNSGLVPPKIIGDFMMAMIEAGPYLTGVTIDIDSGWNAIDGRRL